MSDTTRVIVHKVFMDDQGGMTRKGTIIDLDNSRVEQAVKDGWVTIEGEKVDVKAVSSGKMKAEFSDGEADKSINKNDRK